MSTETRIGDLIALTERLTRSLAAETAAFEAHRPQDTMREADDTARLANLYRQESVRIRREPELLAQAPSLLREALARATEAFQAVLTRHGRAVAAAKTVTEGLVEAIAREVASTRTTSAGYGAAGRTDPANLSAVTLNRRV